MTDLQCPARVFVARHGEALYESELLSDSGGCAELPKKKCCVSSTKCGRCPLRMLKEGTLLPGYTVERRTLVKVTVKAEKSGKPGKTGKSSKKAA